MLCGSTSTTEPANNPVGKPNNNQKKKQTNKQKGQIWPKIGSIDMIF